MATTTVIEATTTARYELDALATKAMTNALKLATTNKKSTFAGMRRDLKEVADELEFLRATYAAPDSEAKTLGFELWEYLKELNKLRTVADYHKYLELSEYDDSTGRELLLPIMDGACIGYNYCRAADPTEGDSVYARLRRFADALGFAFDPVTKSAILPADLAAANAGAARVLDKLAALLSDYPHDLDSLARVRTFADDYADELVEELADGEDFLRALGLGHMCGDKCKTRWDAELFEALPADPEARERKLAEIGYEWVGWNFQRANGYDNGYDEPVNGPSSKPEWLRDSYRAALVAMGEHAYRARLEGHLEGLREDIATVREALNI